MDEVYSRRLKKSLVVYTTLAICLIGVTVAFIAVHPLYNRLKHEQRRHLLHKLEIKKLIVEEYISRARDTALQVTSRTQIRKKLNAYNRGEVSLEELSAYTVPKLTDAMNLSDDMVGITRLDSGGVPVLEVGRPIPSTAWPLPKKGGRSVPILGPLHLDGNTHIVLGANILDRQGVHVGTDLILFEAQGLREIVEDRVEIGAGGETVLSYIEDGSFRTFFAPGGGEETPSGALLAALSGMPVAGAQFPQVGTLEAGPAGEHTQVYALGTLQDPNWVLVLMMDQGELFRAVNRQILYIGAAIAVFILAGLFGMALLLRPLTGRILIHTEEMERQNAELRKLDALKDGLLRDVSHELKTPVAKQVMQLEILKPIVAKYRLARREEDAIRVMEENLARQQAVIRNLLDLSRLESGAAQAAPAPVRLDSLLAQVHENYRYAIDEYGIDFRLKVDPVTIDSNGDMLWHVFSNLVNNAIKFRRRDLAPAITVTSQSMDGEVQVRIADNGTGLREGEEEKVFERFYQASASSEGSGVGLSIVKMMIERLGGRIRLESPGEGKGTTAVVTLPRSDGPSRPAPAG